MLRISHLLVLTDKSQLNAEVELLQALYQRSHWLFDTHGPNIGPIDPHDAVGYFSLSIPHEERHFYSVRHNFGTEMANEGMPLPALANLLGHSDVKMTMSYYNLNKKTIDKARDILNRRQRSIAKDDPREGLINSLMSEFNALSSAAEMARFKGWDSEKRF
jgi:integrase